MFERNKSSGLHSFKKMFVFNSSKQPAANPLYIAGQSFGFEQMAQHCLWKLLTETGYIHNAQLTEMEGFALSNLLKKKSALANGSITGNPEYSIAVLSSAIDKIVCQIKILQAEKQKYQLQDAENRRLRKEVNNPDKRPTQNNKFSISLQSRSINDIGRSKRAVRILQSMGIDTLEKLRTCSLSQLHNQERIGVKTIHDIETILSIYPA